jgi:hypothetical protein
VRRAYDPSCLRGRGRRLGGYPQQQAGDARGLRGQCQLAAGDEIELARFAPDFQHHATQRIAGQRVGRRPQRGLHIRRAHRHQKTRIETELGQAAHRQRAGFNLGEILPHPYQRPPCRRPARQPGEEPRRRGALPPFGKHFMHRSYRQAALQGPIDIRVPERHAPRRTRLRGRGRFDALDAAAQSRKRVRACAGHAPFLLSEFRAATGSSGENQKQAHLFMICSNIKLRPAAESIRIGGLVLHPRNQTDTEPAHGLADYALSAHLRPNRTRRTGPEPR